jgi:hypothetical protein
MTGMKKLTLAIWFIALAFVYTNDIMADEFKLIPSIAVREEFNDNLFFDEDDEEDDYITTVSVGLEVIERTQRLDLDLSATVSPFYYADSDHDELDDVDQNYLGRVSYRISPVFGINANALYDVSNRRDRDIETAGLVLTNDERKRQDYGLGFDYTLTEKASMALSLGYLQDSWDTEDLDQQDLEDYRANLNFFYNLSKWWSLTTGRLNFGFERYRFELLNTETSDTDAYSGTIGAQHWFSETVNLIVDLGVQYTDSDFLISPIEEDNNTEFGGTGQAILEIRGELTRGSIRIGHAIRPGSGSGSTVKRSDVVFNLRRRLAERSVIAIATGFYKNKADRGDYSLREIDENTYFVRPNIRFEFFENFTLEAGYSFIYEDDRYNNEDTRRNLVYLSIAYGLPLFE